ncbi:hypothetical protein GLYMA_02G040802v4 [Glycine max]|uniref:uncharacterized protein isoform X1 n=1 Tax=Glycine max TaxID=3847 RepID=UPI00023BE2F1|nr:uncharacterized protein LOC102662686 isoform X1 [Glycine max]KAG4401662.1 hypothetical protein GLYMA_02G040802v4 [Glycine max]
MTNTEAFQIKSISELLIHPLLWRLTGFVSSVFGFSCYAFSPSFHDLFGHWNPLKISFYTVVSSLLSIFMLFVKRCSGEHGKGFLLKAHVGFVVLGLTSLWSFLEDRGQQGKVEHGFGKMMNLTSTGAFALMAMSLSRQLQFGFDVGVFNFLVGCFLVTTMKMSLKLAPVAAFFCYVLVNIRSISDFLLDLRAHAATQHADDATNAESLDQNIADSSEYNDLLEVHTQHADGKNTDSGDQNTHSSEHDEQLFAPMIHIGSISSPL